MFVCLQAKPSVEANKREGAVKHHEHPNKQRTEDGTETLQSFCVYQFVRLREKTLRRRKREDCNIGMIFE